MVATTGDLKDLVRWFLEGRSPSDLPVLLQSWRAEVCGELLIDVLDGRKKLRVSDPSSSVPIAIE
jgi:ribonuclease D